MLVQTHFGVWRVSVGVMWSSSLLAVEQKWWVLSSVEGLYLCPPQCCGAGAKADAAAGAESREPEIKLPSGSGSFLFIKDLKNFFRNYSWLLNKFLHIVTI